MASPYVSLENYLIKLHFWLWLWKFVWKNHKMSENIQNCSITVHRQIDSDDAMKQILRQRSYDSIHVFLTIVDASSVSPCLSCNILWGFQSQVEAERLGWQLDCDATMLSHKPARNLNIQMTFGVWHILQQHSKCDHFNKTRVLFLRCYHSP